MDLWTTFAHLNRPIRSISLGASAARRSNRAVRVLLGVFVCAAAAVSPTTLLALDADSEAVPLDKVEVQGERTGDQRYNAATSVTLTKTDTPLVNVPQSVTVMTQQQMQDQRMTSIGDVVRYVPGVQAHQGENNRDQVIFRGNSSSADFFVNGVRDDVQYYRDVYNLERIEVLRGPNAMVFGRGGGGGIINRTTKEAVFTPRREWSLSGGSFDHARATVDFNAPLSSKAAVRINGLFEESGSFRDAVELRRKGVNPTATFLPSEKTKLTLSYEYLNDSRTGDRGVTSWMGRPAPVPIELFYGDPDQSVVNGTAHLVTSLVEHTAESGLLVRNRTQFADYDRDYRNFVPGAVNATQTLVPLTSYGNTTTRRNIFNQTDFVYHTDSGGLRHTLLAGVELGRQLTDNFRTTGYFNTTSTTLLVPYAAPTVSAPVTFRQSATDANNHVKTEIAAVYVQDQIEFNEQWQAIAGFRFDGFALHYTNNRTGERLSRRDNLVSPRLAIIYKPLATVSVYGSYSVSHLPSSGDQFASLTTITQQVKPEKFENYEVGMKIDLPRDVFLTAAVYQLDRTNTRATDPNDPTRILQTGSQRSKGLELGLTGTITKRWTASAGYAYQDAYISSTTTAARAGSKVAQVPRHGLSLWNKVQLTERFSFGLGLIRRSDVFATIDNSVTLPGYTRVDAAVFYAINDTWRAQVNVENLLDKKYYINADSNTNISPGSPLAVRAGLTARF